MFLSKPPIGSLLDLTHALGGAVGLWPFFEGGGLTVGDASSAGNHGLLGNWNGSAFVQTDPPTWVAGPLGPCLSFSAASQQYIRVPYSPSLDLTGPLTIAARFNLNTTAANHGIINKTIGGGTNAHYQFQIESGHVVFRVDGTTSVRIDGLATLTAGTWYLVCGTWDGATARYDLFGESGRIESISASFTGPVPGGVGDLLIGTLGNGVYRTDGRIDLPLVLPYGLTEGQVASLAADPFAMLRRASRVAIPAAVPPATIRPFRLGSRFWRLRPAPRFPFRRERLPIGAADLTYLGAFRPPLTVGSTGTQYSIAGMTHRYVSGTLHLMSIAEFTNNTAGSDVYEMTVPDPVIPTDPTVYTDYPLATVAKVWGPVDGGKRALIQSGNPVYMYDINWDDVAGRLYWSFGNYYGALNGDICLGYSTLDDAPGGVATCIAAHPIAGIGGTANSYRHRGGSVRIPQSFADAYCDGKTLGVGFGGWWATGAASSLGPVLTAVDQPNLTANPDGSLLVGTPIVDYEDIDSTNASAPPGTVPVPARRPPDYRNAIEGYCVGGGTDYALLRVRNLTTGADGSGLDYLYPSNDPTFTDYPNSFYGSGGKLCKITFPDGSIQFRTSISYDTVNKLTFSVPFSGGKVPDSSTLIEIPDPRRGATYDPTDGIGYWTFQDYVHSGGVWIDGPRKHGFIVVPTLAGGWMAYTRDGPRVESYRHQLWVYDPADLAAAATGTVAHSLVDPDRIDFSPPGLPAPIPSGRSEPYVARRTCNGLTFDATTKRLYVRIRDGNEPTNQLIYVYSVNC